MARIGTALAALWGGVSAAGADWRRRWRASVQLRGGKMDFAASQVPGWHSTFSPDSVAGDFGIAMVLCLAIPLRKFYGLEDFIMLGHHGDLNHAGDGLIVVTAI